jgi:hypothetical protein
MSEPLFPQPEITGRTAEMQGQEQAQDKRWQIVE